MAHPMTVGEEILAMVDALWSEIPEDQGDPPGEWPPLT